VGWNDATHVLEEVIKVLTAFRLWWVGTQQIDWWDWISSVL